MKHGGDRLKAGILFTIAACLFCLCSCSESTSPSPKTETTGKAPVTEHTVSSTKPTTAATKHIETNSSSEMNHSISVDDLFKKLEESAEAFSQTITMRGKVSEDTIKKAFERLYHEHPEYFWVRNYEYELSNTELTLKLEPFQDYTVSQLQQMYQEMKKKATGIVAGIPQNISAYDKILQIHDYLIRTTTYDYLSVEQGNTENLLIYSAYGCLMEGKAVCEGYARAFQYIMKLLGIESGTCTGSAGNEHHAWNYVRIDDAYYWLDVTWDDTNDMEYPNTNLISHCFFLLNDELFLRSHVLDNTNYYVPVCKEITENYFHKNGLCFEQYDFAAFNPVFSAEFQKYDGAEIMFSSETEYRKALKSLMEEKEIWDADCFKDHSMQITYSKRDDLLVLSFLKL